VAIGFVLLIRVAWMWSNELTKRGNGRAGTILRLISIGMSILWLLPIGYVFFKLFILREDP